MRTLIAIAIPAMTFMLLVTVGLDLTTDDFIRLRRQRIVVLTGLFAPLILLPPIAIALTRIFQTSPDITFGLLLIAACPIGGISNTYSYLARASTALSVTLTSLSCLLASVTVPLVGKGLEWIVSRPLGLDVPIRFLFTQVFLVLGLPVAIGVLARRKAPALAERHQAALRRSAFIGTGIILLLIIADNPGMFLAGLSTTVPMATIFVVISVAVGALTAALVTNSANDRFTIAAEFGTRNVTVAAVIAVTLLGRIEFARFSTAYFLTEVPLMLLAAVLFRRYQDSQAARRVTGVSTPVT